MKINKIMVASLLLLAVLTLGAVSASDNLTASETPDSLELGVDDADILVDEDDGDEIDDEPMYDEGDRQDPEMNVTIPEDIKVGEFFTVEVKLPEDAEGSVEYNYNISGEGYSSFVGGESEVECGEASFHPQITYLTDIVLNIEYSGDYKYNSALQSIPISFDKSDYIFEINSGVYSIDYNHNSFLDILVPDNFNGMLTVVINGKQYSIGRDEESGYYGFDSAILNYGENDVTVSYGGDDVFAEKSLDATLYLVSYFDTPYYITFGSSNVEVLKLPEDATGNITLYAEVEDEFEWNEIVIATGTVKNGIGTVDFSNLDIGKYEDYYLRYVGNYPELQDTFLYFKIEPKVNIPSIISKGEEAYVTVELPEGMEGTLKVIDVIDWDGDIILDSKDIGSAQFVNGVAKVSLSELEIGDYSIQLRCDDINWEHDFGVYVVNTTDFDLDLSYNFKDILKDNENEYDNEVYVNLPSFADGKVDFIVDGSVVKTCDVLEEYYIFYLIDSSNLDYGKHVLEVKYTSNKFKNQSKTIEFNVEPVIIYISDDIVCTARGDYEPDHISLYCMPGTSGNVTVLLDGEVYKIFELSEDSEILSIMLEKVPIKNYNITVIYSGDNNHPATSASCMSNLSYEIDISLYFVEYGEYENLIELALPSDVGDGELIAYIDGKKYNVVQNENVAIVVLSNLAEGDHTLTVKYTGDDIYPELEVIRTIEIPADIGNPSNGSAVDNSTSENPTENSGTDNNNTDNPTVTKQDPNLSVSVSDINVGETAIINISLNEAINGFVTVNDKVVTIVNGKGSLALENLQAGEYPVPVVFAGDDSFNEAYFIDGFKVNRLETPVNNNTVILDDAKESKAPSYSINLPSDATGNLTVMVNGETYTAQLVNGTANVAPSDLPAGDYEVTISYSGDSKYAPFVTKSNTTVIVDPKIVMKQTSVLYTAKYSVTIYGKDGKVASGASVVFYINGKKVKTVKTTKNGVATFTVPSKYVPKKYTIKAVALGKTASKKVTVKKVLTLSTVKVKKSAKKIVLTATLKKGNGLAVKGKTITFTFTGKKVKIVKKVKTNAKGVAKLTIKKSTLNKLKVKDKVTYQATYYKTTVKKTAVVKK
ncbi:Ig-like domain repeat protein [Methanobrevibacter sp.]|uniref:Ig-like domain repeat protein n=1 Tax=Methanobrevibacter sp. TaxID=66852 RepID=UPI00386FBCCC